MTMATVESLTVQQLRCFVAVADEQQFTRAAELLNVAQPSLSAQVNRLEQALGVSLFHRTVRPVTLTDAGEELLPLARRVLASVNDVMRGVAEVEALHRGQVTVGATPSLGTTLLPRVLAHFHQHYPEIALTVVERHSDDLATQLELGALDVALAILPLPRPTLEVTVLATEELVVMVSEDHPLAQHDEVRVADLRDVAVIMFREGYDLRTATINAFARAGFAPTVGLDGAEVGSVHAYVTAGLGAAIVPSIVAMDAPGVKALHLTSPKLERTIGLVRPNHHAPTRATAALIEEITSMISRGEWPSPRESGLHRTALAPETGSRRP
ncbi:MAG: LysR family transcriptional regulator [Acidimicrobiales bacterium]